MKRFAFFLCVILLFGCSTADRDTGASVDANTDANVDASTPGESDGDNEKPLAAEASPVLWEVTEGLEAPESAYFDAGSGFLFVSQVGGGGPTDKDGDGRIAKLSTDGKVIDGEWIKELNAPKGLRSHEGRLWVSDIDRIVGIDIEKGEIAETIDIDGAKFLNDVACDADGAVYVSDMHTNAINRYKDGEVSLFAEEAELEYPNGLLVDGDRMIVAAWGSDDKDKLGRLFSLDLKTGAKTLITEQPTGRLDGVEADGTGGYIVTDWMEGKVLHIAGDGTTKTLLELKQGTADHALLADKNILILPRMMENNVTAYDLNKLAAE